MDNFSRRYYEKELGAGIGPSPSMKEHFGYTEPFRRFVQREGFEPQANEIPNTMPSWMPGDDYLTNFRVGDPYIKVDQGFARLPGAGCEAIHQELKGLNPEDYPDIHKLAILADVTPYSREYNIFRQTVARQSEHQVSPSCPTQKSSRTRTGAGPAHSFMTLRHDSRVPRRIYGVKLRVFTYGFPAPGWAFLQMLSLFWISFGSKPVPRYDFNWMAVSSCWLRATMESVSPVGKDGSGQSGKSVARPSSVRRSPARRPGSMLQAGIQEARSISIVF
jgi:hypothetical protein